MYVMTWHFYGEVRGRRESSSRSKRMPSLSLIVRQDRFHEVIIGFIDNEQTLKALIEPSITFFLPSQVDSALALFLHRARAERQREKNSC